MNFYSKQLYRQGHFKILISSPHYSGSNITTYLAGSSKTRSRRKKGDLVSRTFEFDIRYKPGIAIKAQALADFLVEMVDEEVARDPSWMLLVDRTLSAKGCGAGVILEKKGDIVVELSIKFPVFDNQAKYEALIEGLQLASNMAVNRLTICSDSHIVMSEVTGAYQAKDTLLQSIWPR